MTNEYYNYLVLSIFKFINKYENKKSLNIDTLYLTINMFLQNQKEKHLKDKNTENIINSILTTNKEELLKNFLNEYTDLFYYHNHTIFLEEEVKYDDLSEKVFSLDQENESLLYFNIDNLSDIEFTKKINEVLDIHTIENTIKEYSEIERLIESYYQQLYTKEDEKTIKKEINKLLTIRKLLLNKIYTLESQTKDVYRLLSVEQAEVDSNDYDKIPIISTWYGENEYDRLEDRIYDLYQYAIFGNTTNIYHRVKHDLTNIWLEDEPPIEDEDIDLEEYDLYDEEETDDIEINYVLSNTDDEDRPFYLTYLVKLNEYLSLYPQDKSLIETKRRLLYVLDNIEDKLFQSDNNIISALEKIDKSAIETCMYDFYEKEILLMIDDLFITTDENTLKKLIFISTYYSLTKDKKVIDRLNKYIYHPKYTKYSNEIIEKNINNPNTKRRKQ